MVELHRIFVLVYVGAAVLCLVVASTAWRRRAACGALPLAALMLGIATWAGTLAAMWYVPTLEAQTFWLIAAGLGFWVAPVAVLILAFDIAGMKRWRTPGRIALISIGSFVLANIQWLNPGRPLHMVFVAHAIGTHTHYDAVPGPLYWPFVVFALAMIAVGLVIILRVCLRSSRAARTQAAILFFGGLLPFVAAFVTESRFLPLGGLDLTPLAFLATGILWLGAIRRGALLEILRSEGLYRALTEVTPDIVFVIDGDMCVALSNPAAARFLGRPPEQLKGARVAELFGPLGAKFEDALSRVAATGQPLDSERCITVGETERWLRTSLVPLADVAPGCVLGVSRDVTDAKRLELTLLTRAEEGERRATHDALTGLENSRAFYAALDRALSLARRGAASALLYMDIDRFKWCNDMRGHAYGDEVLISLASLLKTEVREVDLLARVGGDEFAAILAGSTESEAMAVAQRMRASVKALGVDIGIPLDLSVGIVGIEADASVTDMIAAADRSMYECKAAHQSAQHDVEMTSPLQPSRIGYKRASRAGRGGSAEHGIARGRQATDPDACARMGTAGANVDRAGTP